MARERNITLLLCLAWFVNQSGHGGGIGEATGYFAKAPGSQPFLNNELARAKPI